MPVHQDVTLIVNGLECTLDNGLITAKFNKEACIKEYIFHQEDLVKNLGGTKSFYLDCNGGAVRFIPNSLNVVEYAPDIAHIFYTQHEMHNLYVEYHILMRKNTSGIYTYIKVKNNTNLNIEISELRVVYRFDPQLMNKAYNGFIKKNLPLYKNLYNYPKIQDETWQLPNGEYYSKYDLAGYIRQTNFFGVYSKNIGTWLINANHEYYSGGPLKQDLLVHQDALILNYLTSSHFGTPNLNCPPNWNKLYGPWLLYSNFYNNEEEMLADLNKQHNNETNIYPYNWLQDVDFPVVRYSVSGKLKDKISAAIVLHSSFEEDFSLQTLGYSYYTYTDVNGFFNIENIRPNNYKINIYPVSGYNCEILLTSTVSLLDRNQNLGEFNLLPSSPEIIWSIDETDRLSNNFKLSKNPRNYVWQLQVPKEITYIINKNNSINDWYYAQNKLGTWNIFFNDTENNLSKVLRIGLAAASSSSISKSTTPTLQILFNNQEIFHSTYENDKTIYRSALNSGNFYFIKLNIDSSLIKKGLNNISLVLKGGAFMYDCVNYSYA